MTICERLLKFGDYCQRLPINHFLASYGGELVVSNTNGPYKLANPQMLFSMTKSITSLGIGLACDKGLLGLDERVVSFFPKESPQRINHHLQELTIRHLLMMSPGMKTDHYQSIMFSTNWVKAFLAQEFNCRPGKTYLYSTPSSHILSAIISVVANRSLVDFLEEHLFYPMEISKPQWETSPEGLTCGGMGLSLTPMELLKIGELLLNEGNYKGRQLISSGYLSQATSWQIQKERDGKFYSGDSYGYQFHLSGEGCFRLDGAFGQLVFISPAHKLVMVVLSRGVKQERILKLINEYVFEQRKLLPAEETFIPQPSVSLATDMEWLLGRQFRLKENCLNVLKCQVLKGSDVYGLKLVRVEHSIDIEFHIDRETRGQTWFIKDRSEYLQEYHCQTVLSDNKLTLVVSFIETPYVVTIQLTLVNGQVAFSFDINLSFTLSSFSQIVE